MLHMKSQAVMFTHGEALESNGAAQAICAKARKLSKQSAELKDDLEAFEARLDADAAEVAEEHAAARAARKQVIMSPFDNRLHLTGRCVPQQTFQYMRLASHGM